MDDRDCLAHYPFVVVRIASRVCARRGSYRLARLAAKFGPEISLRDLADRFSYYCMWRAEAHGRKGKSGCGVHLPDLEHQRNLVKPVLDLPGGIAATRGQPSQFRAETSVFGIKLLGIMAPHTVPGRLPLAQPTPSLEVRFFALTARSHGWS
jgi:hypothetical protein